MNNKSKCGKREIKYPPPPASGAIVMPNIKKYEMDDQKNGDVRKEQILS